MELVYESSESGMRAMLIRGLGHERNTAELELLDAGLSLPLSHRAVWAAHHKGWEPCFLLVRDASGHARAGVAIEFVRTHALPGHVILRVGRFGGSLPGEANRVALEAIASLAKSTPRVLWVQVNVFSRDGREAIGKTLEELGFHEVRPPSAYRYTLVIDLKPSEDEIFSSFSESTRRHIRKTANMLLRSVAVVDPIYAERIKELHQAAFQRTGGHSSAYDWHGVLRMSKEHPNLSHIVGLFQGEDTTPESMGAFVWGCNHGDHWEYRAAGSERQANVRVPLGYILTWDMIRWAKAAGAEWFDMGGVTLAEGTETALEGISRFKRGFSREVVEVGAEWVLEPAPARARIARTVSRNARRISAWMRNKA